VKYVVMAIYAFVIFYTFELVYPERNFARLVIVAVLLFGGCFTIEKLMDRKK
jgi:hypothetical protein